MTDSPRRFPLAFLVLDALGTGSSHDRILPGGTARYAGTAFGFADNDRDLCEIGRAVGIEADVALFVRARLPCIQIPVAPMRSARIDPILQFVNDQPVLDHQNATAPLDHLKAACEAARSPTARVFLMDLRLLGPGA